MEKYYDDILPCLKSVGSWWTEPDRRLLFCHLLMIYPFDEEYLSGIPAATYYEGVERCVMSEHIIRNSLQVFKKVNGTKKCTCAGIRNLEFSFGKLNPRVCYLCPYSGTFKNMRQADERRFLYHLMTADNRSMSSYLELEQKKIEDVFLSYFPVYVNDILVDAYPFLFFAEWFLLKESGYYKKNEMISRKELLDKVYKDIEQRIPYLRIKELVEREQPNYRESVKKAADEELEALERENFATRPINELMMIRLFRILESKKKYVHKKPSEYISRNQGPFAPNLFSSSLLLKENAEAVRKEATEPENPLIHLEDEDFKKLPDLDEILISGRSEIKTDSCVDNIGIDRMDNEEERIKDVLNKSPEDTLALTELELKDVEETGCKKHNEAFRKAYHIEDGMIEPLFVYGRSEKKKEDALLNVFINGSEYFSMEPAEYHGVTGLLLMNSDSDYIFYSIEQYGAKPIRAIADQGKLIYTSNIYRLGRYLFRSKVYKIIMKDVGIALFLFKNIKAQSLSEISHLEFPECMKEYKEIYCDSLKNLGTEQRVELDDMEKYTTLLCADGGRPPFQGMDSLCYIHNSVEYEYLYRAGMHPDHDGVFLFLRAFLKDKEMDKSLLKELYMKTCIELSHKVQFYDGSLQILDLSDKGILLYVMGNRLFIQKVQLYISACARRAFSDMSSKNCPVTFEQMAQEYSVLKEE